MTSRAAASGFASDDRDPETDTTLLTLQTGSTLFHIESGTLVKASSYFKQLLTADASKPTIQPHRTEAGAYIVRANPDTFQHIINFAEHGKYPFFFQPGKGFDLERYADVYHLAMRYGVDRLATWIEEKEYVNAILVAETRSIQQVALYSIKERHNDEERHLLPRSDGSINVVSRDYIIHYSALKDSDRRYDEDLSIPKPFGFYDWL